MKTVCPIVEQVKGRDAILRKINELEVKAQVYSETDWERYNEVCAELKNLDTKLLDIYNKENETFLQNHKGA